MKYRFLTISYTVQWFPQPFPTEDLRGSTFISAPLAILLLEMDKVPLTTTPAGSHESEGPPRKRARGPLSNDIADMLFGFGDSWPPNSQTVNLVEALVTEYIKDLGARALQVADLRPNGKLDKECFLYLVRKDRSKFQRVNKLLVASREIKQAQIVEEHDEQKQKALNEESKVV